MESKGPDRRKGAAGSPAAPSPPADADNPSLDVARWALRRWADTFARMDAGALAAMYTREAVFLGKGAQVYRGRDGVQAYFNALFPRKSAGVEFDAIIAVPLGADVLTLAASATFDLGGDAPRRLRLTQTLLRVEGRWEIASHHAAPAAVASS